MYRVVHEKLWSVLSLILKKKDFIAFHAKYNYNFGHELEQVDIYLFI